MKFELLPFSPSSFLPPPLPILSIPPPLPSRLSLYPPSHLLLNFITARVQIFGANPFFLGNHNPLLLASPLPSPPFPSMPIYFLSPPQFLSRPLPSLSLPPPPPPPLLRPSFPPPLP